VQGRAAEDQSTRIGAAGQSFFNVHSVLISLANRSFSSSPPSTSSKVGMLCFGSSYSISFAVLASDSTSGDASPSSLILAPPPSPPDRRPGTQGLEKRFTSNKQTATYKITKVDKAANKLTMQITGEEGVGEGSATVEEKRDGSKTLTLEKDGEKFVLNSITASEFEKRRNADAKPPIFPGPK